MNKPLFPDVTVNGETISAADIAAEAQNHAAPAGKPGFAWRAGARALVVRTLLLQQSRRLGLKPRPRDLGQNRFETDEEALIREVLDLSLTPEIPTAAMIADVYAKDPDKFRAPSLFEPAHILFAADPDNADARSEACKKAQAALAALRDRPDGFDQLAGELSDCPSRDAGGRLGQITSGDTVPEFESALMALEPGEICPEPVETRYGFHIVRLDAKAIGDVLPLERVSAQISEGLEKSAWARAARDFTNRLVADADIIGLDMAAPIRAG